ncbi:hypothetical protein UFOVP1596_16 [uncultured Caudovirales phage]|uniref:Uncharacterized protein n=1 Tax=uncultured Caudovirales phage TaxID=2100421 RepID=A0A6J5STF6_9CAUD|nr:hypothetical protein UFOVP1596_16 [uncultured Caudovirales phage]
MLTELQRQCIIYLFTLERVYWTQEQIAEEVGTTIWFVSGVIDEWFGDSCKGLNTKRDIELSEMFKIKR